MHSRRLAVVGLAVAVAVLAVLAAVAFFFWLSRPGESSQPEPPAPAETVVRAASAALQPLGGTRAAGVVTFSRPVPDKVTVSYTLRHVPAGVYNLRLHEIGDCSSRDGSSAGGPFAGEAGKLTEVSVNELGWARATVELREVELQRGPTGILGRSILLETVEAQATHVACGVIR